jgi:predicted ATPase
VNHHLEKSLFTEKLYRLFCASTLMVPIDLDEDDPWSYYALAQPAAVRLFLQDGDGNKVELQDVGSGIPFVLPILYAVACGKVVKIQQPELHLHPALQSSIADVFVEEFNCNPSTQFIIETHSEHLLLRLLRRIRDVEKGKCLSEDVRLTNGQLAVYYFDPQVSGGTVVTQQLVTPLGDFYTDWPRGFFSERNRDLFDD